MPGRRRGGGTTECPPPSDVLGRIGRWTRWDAELEAAWLARPDLVWQAQHGYEVLFGTDGGTEPGPAAAGFAGSAGDALRPAVRRGFAVRVARWHGATLLVRHHRELGVAAELPDDEPPADSRLCAALDFLDLITVSPALATEGDQRRLAVAGWTPDQVVALAQISGFTSFQAKLLAGLERLGGRPPAAANPPARTTIGHGRTGSPAPPAARPAPSTQAVRPAGTADDGPRPSAYTLGPLDWTAWVPPVPSDDLDVRQGRLGDGPVGGGDGPAGEYERVLARIPDLLRARTRMRRSVLAGTGGGLPPAERELAAVVASMVNDCVHDAAAHARRAVRLSGRVADVQRLLEVPLHRDPLWRPVDLGLPGEGQPPRWAAIVDFAAALAATPSMPTTSHVRQLRAQGLGLDQVLDLVAAVAFASWENRLTLALGEPSRPTAPAAPAALAPAAPPALAADGPVG